MDTLRRWVGRFYMGAFLALLIAGVWIAVHANKYMIYTVPLLGLGFVLWVVSSVTTFWLIDKLQPILIDANRRRRLNFHWSRSYWTLAFTLWITSMGFALFKAPDHYVAFFAVAGAGVIVVCGLFRRWVMYVTRVDVQF